jgi:hypothetical protein
MLVPLMLKDEFKFNSALFLAEPQQLVAEGILISFQ